MKLRRYVTILLLVLCAATVALGATYNWSGTSSPAYWNDQTNWLCKGACFCGVNGCGFPDAANDDATIKEDPSHYPPVIVGTVLINANWAIDDLSISDSDPTFRQSLPLQPPVRLKVDSLLIAGEADVTIMFNVEIFADGSN